MWQVISIINKYKASTIVCVQFSLMIREGFKAEVAVMADLQKKINISAKMKGGLFKICVYIYMLKITL